MNNLPVLDVAVVIVIRRGRGGGRERGVHRFDFDELLRREEEEAARVALQARGEEAGHGLDGDEGDAEERGEAGEEVERRAAEQPEDLVGGERLRVARQALPRRPPKSAPPPPPTPAAPPLTRCPKIQNPNSPPPRMNLGVS
ncbi:hypothetical protein OsJ_13034 [Oryza sativa Japonica Group]|uniref:Uncharacterized protein n=1 Tax=Oryza sativa subsp. japonica TaxID=39947 RepID=B9F6V4_ORYSJ|nr:hypothetical protein OsJ_13034 [Oryza sativa Japonica Group]